MKSKDFLIDYCAYILLKVIGPLIRVMPLVISFFIGEVLGDLFYLFDLKHRVIVYANIKTALGGKFSPAQLRGITRGFYRAFGQNIIEVFYIPKFDQKYLRRYVVIEGYQNIQDGFQKGKGVIFLAMHAGGWELANIICANLGFAFNMFVREQKFPQVEKVLNFYRGSKGCRFIQRENQLKELIRVLKANESVAMTIDQGGKNGTLVKFFNKNASLATGALRLALKLDCALIPVFPIRIKGPYIKFWVEPAFKLQSTGNLEEDVQNNLAALARIFEKYISEYPREYLWSYKIWKYSNEKNILILSDGKTGHLRQSEALAKIVLNHLKSKGITGQVKILEVKPNKNRLAVFVLTLISCFSGKFVCQGCMFCLRIFLNKESYLELVKPGFCNRFRREMRKSFVWQGLRAKEPQAYSAQYAEDAFASKTQPGEGVTRRSRNSYCKFRVKDKWDVIISCGSSLAAVNFQLAKENQAKSLVIMRPSILSTRKFDLVVMPKHDRPLPGKNIAIIQGALNLIDQDYLKKQAEQLIRETGIVFSESQPSLGLLLGGNTKNFQLKEDVVKEALVQLKDLSIKFNAQILAATSRRTPIAVDSLVKKELFGFSQAKLAIIANEQNFPSAVGGILGLCQIVVVSGESISMISEAVSSLKQVVVFKSPGLSVRHQLFLENFFRAKYIHLVEAGDIGKTIERIFSNPPEIVPLKDNEIVLNSLRRMF